jgi:hypothetical protein
MASEGTATWGRLGGVGCAEQIPGQYVAVHEHFAQRLAEVMVGDGLPPRQGDPFRTSSTTTFPTTRD